jgi:hypothetical protein
MNGSVHCVSGCDLMTVKRIRREVGIIGDGSEAASLSLELRMSTTRHTLGNSIHLLPVSFPTKPFSVE